MPEARPGEAPARDFAAEIREQQIKLLYRHARLVFLPPLLTAPALVYVLWSHARGAQLLAWIAILYVATAARATVVWMYGRRAVPKDDSPRWGWTMAALCSLNGVIWGAAGFLFFDPTGPLSLAFLAAVIAAMIAGAVNSFSPFLPAYVLFAIPCLVPFIARSFWQWRVETAPQASAYLILGLVAIVFLLVHIGFARTAHRTTTESIRLRFEKLDLVEQLTLEKERAEAASVAKSKFLAAASHDLRQPMHAMGLFIDALRSEPHAPKSAKIVDSVRESHLAATGLLDTLLDFSRVDAGITKPAVTSFPVQRVLDQLLAEYAVQASAADLELRSRACRAHVRSDPVLLARMLGNLVSNAIRYTEEGRVLIGCRRDAEHLRIEVHDTGIGIPREQHRAIFREFYQVDPGTRRRRRAMGMGLGLAIVSGLAKALDHPVSVESTPGKGSVFAVRVPICEPHAEAVVSPAVLTDNLRGRTILVVDDEPAICDAVAEVLLRWGCRPVTAASAEDAARSLAARGERPDAMVVDYQLEAGASGVDAIARLQQVLGANVPAIIVTGDTLPERLREASDIGYPLLYKPLAPMRLRAALTAALQGAPRSAPTSPQRARA
jgi:signal transduction histidine kinase/CheY-like chemotaxis protein